MIDFVNSSLYKEEGIHKQLQIVSGSDVITNSDLHAESFELYESLCEEENLHFGCCEASSVKFRLKNPFNALKGKEITVYNILNKDENNPLKIGKYKVYSDVPSADRSYRDITAYDFMYDIINTNVAAWYDEVLPDEFAQISLKDFRMSFASHFGLQEESISLINDSMVITRTIDADEISGKMVLSAICEINGCFARISRDGKLKYIYLDTNKNNAIQIGSREYKGSPNYEDYVVQNITGLQIRMEENDIGVVVGDDDNTYVIEDNFLVYGMSESQLTTVAQNVLSKISGISYRPFSGSVIGNPCVEVGDVIVINTKTIPIESYVLRRTLSGIQVLSDDISASGEEFNFHNFNTLSNDIRKLKGKTNALTRTLDETISLIKDEENGLETQIKQNAEQIKLSVKDGEVVANLNLEKGVVQLKGNRIVIESTNFSVSSEGNIVAKAGKIAEWNISGPHLYAENNEKFTTLKANGSVAIALGSPAYDSTTGANVQLWHDGRVRFGWNGTGYNFEVSPTTGNVTIKGEVVCEDKITIKASSDGATADMTFKEQEFVFGSYDVQKVDGKYDMNPSSSIARLLSFTIGSENGLFIDGQLHAKTFASDSSSITTIYTDNLFAHKIATTGINLCNDGDINIDGKSLKDYINKLGYDSILKENITNAYDSIEHNGLKFYGKYVYPKAYPNSTFLIVFTGMSGDASGSAYIAILGEDASSDGVSITRISRDVDYVYPVLSATSSGYLRVVWSGSKQADVRANIFKLS